MTQVADILGHLEVLVFGDLEVAGVTGQLVAIERFFTQMNRVLELYLVGIFATIFILGILSLRIKIYPEGTFE